MEGLAQRVGLPIDPPQRNVNSRFALETAELVRERAGDAAAGAFHHDVSRAFFTAQADIAKLEIVAPLAARHGVASADVAAAWEQRRYRAAVDAFIRQAAGAGVRGVPAMAWPGQPAVMGMMEPARLVAALQRRR